MDQIKMKIDSAFSNCSWSIPTFSQRSTRVQSQNNILVHDNSNIEWSLVLDPYSIQDKKHVSVFLNVITKNKIIIHCRFIAQDNDGMSFKTLEFFNNFSESKSWGFREFLKRETISSLKDDTLIIKCSIIVIPVSENGHIIYNCINEQINMLDGYNNLLTRGSFSDVILQTSDGSEFFAHKCILGSCSPVFEDMFEHCMKNYEGKKVTIRDIKPNVLKALMDYVYLHKFNGEMSNLDLLLIASNRYQIIGLKAMCEMELCAQLTSENAVDYLILAKNSYASKLKEQALNFIKINIKDIGEKNTLKNLEKHPDLLYAIIEYLSK